MGATAAAVGARSTLDALAGQPLSVILTVPIILTAYAGGLLPGMLATALACLATSYLFMPPLYSVAVASTGDRWQLALLAVAGALISVLSEVHHRDRRRHAARAESDRELAQQLAREKSRLVAAQSVAKVGSWENEIDTGTLTWSEETHRIFGTVPGEFAPSYATFRLLVHPADRAALDDALARSLREPRAFEVEHRVVTPDGRVKTVAERWQTFFDHERRPVLAVGTCHDITERRAAEALRDGYRERLHLVARRLVARQEEERRTIAIQLHEEVGQRLSVLGLQLTQLGAAPEHPDAHEVIRAAQATFRDVCAALRRLVNELRPDELHEFGLVAALRALADGAHQRYGFSMIVEAPVEDHRLPDAVESAFFRIAQEALANAIQHAGTPRILVKFHARAEKAMLIVADHGRGFDRARHAEQESTDGWGLPMMRERAESVGARLRMASRPGRGTAVFVSWRRR